ncbi:MAG: GNAT family N-acetyltransferase [Bdellovibrionales bacterium]|nr:GNAT family N-acetyltransferase [Bdellovibrionales bacterium]
MNKFETQVLTTYDELEALEDEWNKLIDEDTGAHPYQTHAWQLAWWGVYGEAAALRLILVTRKDSDELVAIFPMYIAKQIVEKVRITSLEFIGTRDYTCDYAAPILSSQLSDKERSEIFDLTFSLFSEAPLIQLSNIRDDSPYFEFLNKLSYAHTAVPYHAWSTKIDMNDPEAIPNRGSTHKILKRYRKAGKPLVQHFRTAEEILPLLDTFFEQHNQRWKPIVGESQFEDPKQRELFTAFVKALCPNGNLVFSALWIDENLLAAHFGYLFRRRFYWYKPSYNPEFRKLSPGKLLLAEVYRYAAQETAKVFDFTIGDEEYKAPFTETKTNMYRFRIPQSLLVRGYLNGFEALRSMKRSLVK